MPVPCTDLPLRRCVMTEVPVTIRGQVSLFRRDAPPPRAHIAEPSGVP